MTRPAKEIAALRLNSSTSRIVLVQSPRAALQPLDGGDRTTPIDLLVCDANTVALVPEEWGGETAIVPAGERCKDPSVLNELLAVMTSRRLTRDSVVAALGGGAVTDLVAFAASVYLRGIDVVLVPSTLLAMVDAAVGGKTGIDLGGYKNLVGTFSPAREVRIAPELLSTLPPREFRSGLAEVIKAALLGDSTLLALLEKERDRVLARDTEVMAEVIGRAVAVKVAVVQEDYTEQGVRAHLNLGHTFGHALESVMGLGSVTHGEAVAWGIGRAVDAAERLALIDPEWAGRTRRLLNAYGYDLPRLPAGIAATDVLAAMQFDKKRRRDGIRFVLQRGPQDTVLQPLSVEILRDVLETGA
jgi:3-dehydroquinate synthase